MTEYTRFAFKADTRPVATDVTACLYTNEAWLPLLPAFVESWDGPVSLVVQADHSRTSLARKRLLRKLDQLRSASDAISATVDIHIVGQPRSTSPDSLSRTRHRLLTQPTALNWHLNVARFFAQTDLLLVAGDARLTPSPNLHDRLLDDAIRQITIDRGDVVVVPTFAFSRETTVFSVDSIREDLSQPGPSNGIGSKEMSAISEAYVDAIESTLPVERSEWPESKDGLLMSPHVIMYDSGWEAARGPTNWFLWQKTKDDDRLSDLPEHGGGVGLAPDGAGTGGGDELYKIADYDMHYAPHVVISRRGQPWCTERFESMPAACTYQMYLTGAELYALPDAWLFTVKPIDQAATAAKEEDALVRLRVRD